MIRKSFPDAEETKTPTSVQTTLPTFDPNLNGLRKDHDTNDRTGSLQQDSNTNLTLPFCRELIQSTAGSDLAPRVYFSRPVNSFPRRMSRSRESKIPISRLISTNFSYSTDKNEMESHENADSKIDTSRYATGTPGAPFTSTMYQHPGSAADSSELRRESLSPDNYNPNHRGPSASSQMMPDLPPGRDLPSFVNTTYDKTPGGHIGQASNAARWSTYLQNGSYGGLIALPIVRSAHVNESSVLTAPIGNGDRLSQVKQQRLHEGSRNAIVQRASICPVEKQQITSKRLVPCLVRPSTRTQKSLSLACPGQSDRQQHARSIRQVRQEAPLPGPAPASSHTPMRHGQKLPPDSLATNTVVAGNALKVIGT